MRLNSFYILMIKRVITGMRCQLFNLKKRIITHVLMRNIALNKAF